LKILFLTNKNAGDKEEIIDFIQFYGDQVLIHFDRFDIDFVKNNKIDFIVSDRYQYIVSADIINLIEGNAINTHPSMLPLQRGYQPNFFSIYYNTRKGVTIHKMDEGLDTGDILVQQELFFNEEDTLRTSHYICRKTIVYLFCSNWYNIKNGKIKSTPQDKNGNMNNKSDFERIFSKFTKGWDTKIKYVKE
tara:strand:- start:486 stop:1058 length:573 start_codon:yes stop_codon:yes gene_type:complete